MSHRESNDVLLEHTIHDLLSVLKTKNGSSDEEAKAISQQLNRLYEIRRISLEANNVLVQQDLEQQKIIIERDRLEHEIETADHISPNTLVMAATNLIGILLIVKYEQAHVMVSKAATFALKLR